ncbi:hypothetical protein OHA61_37050 [Streptomyces sp. NBC_00885]|uniref:hypothetical protein n=1 Tax=Streptomyces sp. NBC_00885 TaxID=2975857 RepID=UPI00386467D2|nr:hypothetical protein OHA61_37050 [Streptomyces sp. NBC_00885]
MTPEELATAADPTILGNYLAELPQQPHHHGPLTSTRQDEFQGHSIVIKTTYEVTVDGAPIAVPLMVSNDGRVHCHALPTYEFLSAMDTIRSLIENFPDDFPGGDGPGGGDNGGHPDHHAHRTDHQGSV